MCVKMCSMWCVIRSSMLKTTAIEGIWSGNTVLDLAIEVHTPLLAACCRFLVVALASFSSSSSPLRPLPQKMTKAAASADEVCDRIKLTAQYYEIWEPPPHSKLRLKFYQRVLIPRLPADRMRHSLTVRGDLITVAKCRNKVCLLHTP